MWQKDGSLEGYAFIDYNSYHFVLDLALIHNIQVWCTRWTPTDGPVPSSMAVPCLQESPATRNPTSRRHCDDAFIYRSGTLEADESAPTISKRQSCWTFLKKEAAQDKHDARLFGQMNGPELLKRLWARFGCLPVYLEAIVHPALVHFKKQPWLNHLPTLFYLIATKATMMEEGKLCQ